MTDRPTHEAVPEPHEQDEIGTNPPEGAGAKPRFPDLPLVRAALEAGQIGIWSWDIGSGAIRWSDNMEDIHDLPAGSFDGTFSSFQQDIHPDDRAEVQAAIQESLRSGKPYHVQYRLAPRP